MTPALDLHLIALESLAERLARAGFPIWAKEIDAEVLGIKEATRAPAPIEAPPVPVEYVPAELARRLLHSLQENRPWWFNEGSTCDCDRCKRAEAVIADAAKEGIQ